MDKFNAGAKLIVDNPQQVQNSNQLLTLIDAMFVADRALEDASRASVSGSENIKVALNAAQSSLVRVRQKINDMEAIEGKLLDERSTDATQSLRSFLIAIGSGVAVVAATLLIWWQMMQRAVVALAQTNADLSAAFVRQQNSESQIRQLQKMEAIGQLTGGLAHDFNNMLAVVIGALSLAQKRLSKGSADVAPLIAGAMDGATRAATLTSRLLAFSRQQPLTPETLNLNSIVGNMAEIIRRTIGDGIRVETVLAGGLWLTRVDASQMENALLNLCVNARDAMPDGGALTIETGNANLDDEYARGSIDVKSRPIRVDRGDRHGNGYVAGCDVERNRALFHHQGVGQRQRPRAQSGVRLRQTIRWPFEDIFRTRSRHDDENLPAAQDRRRN